MVDQIQKQFYARRIFMPETKKDRPIAGKLIKPPKGVSGFKEVMAAQQPDWQKLNDVVSHLSRSYGYEYLELPIFETPHLWTKAWGKEQEDEAGLVKLKTDEKDNELILRPACREGVARAFLESYAQVARPWKVWYWAPVFKYVAEQKIEQSWQFGADILGDDDPIADAQIIIMAWRLLEQLRLPTTLHINSWGCSECRGGYLKLLNDYFKTKRSQLPETVLNWLPRSPWRLFNTSQPQVKAVCEGAPQIVDHLCTNCNNHLVSVLEYLDEVEIPYQLDPLTIPTTDYFTRTVFEIVTTIHDDHLTEVEQVILSGGRYDELLTRLGGSTLGGVGYNAQVEEIIKLINTHNISLITPLMPQIMLAQLGPEARKHAIVLFEQLRQARLTVATILSSGGLKNQLEEAQRLGVRYAAIVGQREILDGTVLVRDMENGIQEVVERSRLAAELLKRLSRDGLIANGHDLLD